MSDTSQSARTLIGLALETALSITRCHLQSTAALGQITRSQSAFVSPHSGTKPRLLEIYAEPETSEHSSTVHCCLKCKKIQNSVNLSSLGLTDANLQKEHRHPGMSLHSPSSIPSFPTAIQCVSLNRRLRKKSSLPYGSIFDDSSTFKRLSFDHRHQRIDKTRVGVTVRVRAAVCWVGFPQDGQFYWIQSLLGFRGD